MTVTIKQVVQKVVGIMGVLFDFIIINLIL